MDVFKSEILVIDDVPTNTMLLSVMLKNLGHTVREAKSAAMGMELIKENKPHIILLDVDMPDMNGYEMCEELKKNPNLEDIPVIFISALDELADKIKGFSVGGIDYITKPFKVPEVKVRVETHLALRQLQLELQEKNKLLEAELARAGIIQNKLLPKSIPSLPCFELAASCVPLKEVGGDFYDWQQINDDHINLTMGDVMGKGMAAALLMTTVRATLRALSKQASPIEQLENAQILLEADLSPSESFVTLFHGQLNTQNKTLEYIDVGHGLVIMKRANGTIERLTRGGFPMGIIANQNLKGSSIEFHSGDMLFLFTDGLMELFPEAGTSPEEFLKLVDHIDSAQGALDKLFDEIHKFDSPPDDVTVMILACK